MTSRAATATTLAKMLTALGVSGEEGARPHEWVVSVPGTARKSVTVSFLVHEHEISATAFVCRRPEENHERVYAFLLRRNFATPGVAYALDGDGDIFVTARLAAEAVSQSTVDRLLGALVMACDGAFNDLLKLGFATSIQQEYHWRVARGESLANLAAFTDITGQGQGASD